MGERWGNGQYLVDAIPKCIILIICLAWWFTPRFGPSAPSNSNQVFAAPLSANDSCLGAMLRPMALPSRFTNREARPETVFVSRGGHNM